MIKKILPYLLLFTTLAGATDISVDASQAAPYKLRKIFDVFRAANGFQPGRLSDIHSRKARMFPAMTGRMYGFGDFFDVVRGSYPNFTYNFDTIDNSYVGPIIADGSDLILGYCYMPVSLSAKDAYSPPDNYDAWEEFNFQWAKHFHSKYGINTFEVWNEPDFSDFFTGGQADYFKMYNYAVKGIRRAVPSARVGGPALANNTGWIGPFLDYCAQNNLPVNFISYHAQDNGLKDTGSKYVNRYQDIVAELDIRGLTDVDIICDEFSYELDPAQGSKYDKSSTAAWFAGTFKYILENMPRLSRFNKTIVDNGSSFSKWKYNGLITENNIPKAKYNVFRMYGMMPDSAIHITVSDNDLNAMAAINDTSAAVMIWNKNNNPVPLALSLKNLPFSSNIAKWYVIDATHASYFDDSSTSELQLTGQISNSGTSFSYNASMTANSVYLFVLDSTGVVNALQDETPLPQTFRLKNYPNPFNPSTTIEYVIQKSTMVRLDILDIRGRTIKHLVNRPRNAGLHRVHFEAENLPSGIYFYRITTDRRVSTKKMMLLR